MTGMVDFVSFFFGGGDEKGSCESLAAL